MINTRNEVNSHFDYTKSNTQIKNNDLEERTEVTVEDVLRRFAEMEKAVEENNQVVSQIIGKIETATETIHDINELNRNRNRQALRENDRGLFERIGTGLLTGAQWIARCIPHRFHSHRDHSSDSATNR